MRVLWISAVVLFVDQVTKIAVLNFMYRGQSIPLVGDWLRLTFTENPGMAFGIQVGPPGTVTVMASLATLLIAGYIWQVRNAYLPYRVSLAFIFGGALGNIVDRIFYGTILGYGDLFTGRVVDFIHVSLWRGFVPEAVPLVGGAYFELFPIWNVADMAIVLGVVGVLVLYRGFHEEEMERYRRAEAAATTDAPDANGPAHSSDPSSEEEPAREEPSEEGPVREEPPPASAGERAPAGSSTTTDPAPAVPEAAPRNGQPAGESVAPKGPSDSAPPEVPVLEDTDRADDAATEAGSPPAGTSPEEPGGTPLGTGPEDDEPSGDEPGKDEASKNEPGKNEPGKNEPGKNESGKDEPGRNEAGDASPPAAGSPPPDAEAEPSSEDRGSSSADPGRSSSRTEGS